ncbi:MAG TPA: DUF2255 family protein [Propionibacteriaceae bacterium]|jgi:hypothetical protein|nr:DUF2255 family protein [Propionibacteriaceae bacterium]
MSGWSQADLATIGEADEIEVAPDRADHTAASWVPIWVVRVGDELYVRSFRGPSGSWYRRARDTGHGRIRVAGTERTVVFITAEPSTRTEVDDAYRAKYGRYGSSYITPMISDSVAGTTLRLTAPTE